MSQNRGKRYALGNGFAVKGKRSENSPIFSFSLPFGLPKGKIEYLCGEDV